MQSLPERNGSQFYVLMHIHNPVKNHIKNQPVITDQQKKFFIGDPGSKN